MYKVSLFSTSNLYEEYKLVKLIEVEGVMVVARAWGERKMRRYYSTGIKFQLCKMNKP